MRGRAEPWLVAGALAGAYLVVAPESADLAAHAYRAGLVDRDGLVAWNNGWYGGHHAVGYSALFPPLAGATSPRLVGAVGALLAGGLLAALVPARWGSRGRIAGLWLATASLTLLLSGRMPFALGLAVGLGALLALRRRRTAVAGALAFASALVSPVAGLFLAVAATAWGLAERRPGGLVVAGLGLLPVVALALAFPEGGSQPFVASAYLPVLALAAAVLALVPREERTLRIGAVVYAVVATVAFVVPSPVGGNAARLGALVGGPLLLAAAAPRRGLVLAAVLAPLAFWQWSAAVRDAVSAADDPAVEAAYHEPLLAFLARQPGPPGRLEALPTRDHWEAAHLAPHVPLARGWQRQLDRRFADLFYEDRLDPVRYRDWLWDHAVRWVAVPDAPLDPSAEDEARLVASRPPFLRPAGAGEHWQVWEVVPAAPMVRGPGTLRALGTDSFAVDARRGGTLTVQVRFSAHWALTSGRGCVERAEGGWTRLRLARPGPARVAFRFAPGRILDDGPRCR